MKKLNGWKRIGIVLSILWIVSWAIYLQMHRMNRAYEFAYWKMDSCYQYRITPNKDCLSEFSHNVQIAMIPYWPDALIIAFAPIPVIWLSIYIIIGIVSWIRAGFANSTKEIG